MFLFCCSVHVHLHAVILVFHFFLLEYEDCPALKPSYFFFVFQGYLKWLIFVFSPRRLRWYTNTWFVLTAQILIRRHRYLPSLLVFCTLFSFLLTAIPLSILT